MELRGLQYEFAYDSEVVPKVERQRECDQVSENDPGVFSEDPRRPAGKSAYFHNRIIGIIGI